MKYVVFIAGSGGIGSAVGMLLRLLWEHDVDLILGDISSSNAEKAKAEIEAAGAAAGRITTLDMSTSWEEGVVDADILLDCLPGKFAPKMAKVALKNNMHYVNLTEYVAETKEILSLAKGASVGLALQAGLAPGFVNVLGHGLFKDFCEEFSVEKAERLEMRVGALGRNAVAPHFYAFTWSPIGVATEYIKDAEILRDYKMTRVASLSETKTLLINGRVYEEAYTSGGAADIPIALAGRVRHVDYKTLRYPGHFRWIKNTLERCPNFQNPVQYLESYMLANIPRVEEDEVIIYTAVEGFDQQGSLHRREVDYRVLPLQLQNGRLRAIQSTTAAGMAECARILLTEDIQGPLLQSQIDPKSYLSGPFVSAIYK
ncbi:MAG: saccharopine dehydrogenase C-terminal domain-containing protein [Myxococcota bacterium]|nr:saccharopine dehydrogenase C-terminal domain-containing protein [Myxococcota bacterium]